VLTFLLTGVTERCVVLCVGMLCGIPTPVSRARQSRSACAREHGLDSRYLVSFLSLSLFG